MPPSPTAASPDPPASPGPFVADRPPGSPQEGGASDAAGGLARILGRCVAPAYALGARLDRAWGIAEPWVGIGFGIERLLMVAKGSRSLGRMGRSLSYLDGIRLNL